MANAVQELAKRTPGKEAMAIESFAKALMMVSVCVCLLQLLFTCFVVFVYLSSVLLKCMFFSYCVWLFLLFTDFVVFVLFVNIGVYLFLCLSLMTLCAPVPPL